MPKLVHRTPSYRLHKATGQAVVTINGRDIYLGAHGTQASRDAYDRAISEWLGNSRSLPTGADLTVVELILKFLQHARVYYRRPDGTPTSEVDNFIEALTPVKHLYGGTDAVDFGPRALKAVRDDMIKRGWCRTHINRQVNRVKHVFKWGGGAEIIPTSVHHGLTTVPALKEGRSEARESSEVEPAPDFVVDAVRPRLCRRVRAMVELQEITGMRPGEVCGLRGRELDRTNPQLWVYKPKQHKTAHRGHKRTIYMGPQAQAVLLPFLKLNPDSYVFSPAEAEQERRAALAAQRKTPRSCGNLPGSNRRRRARKAPGERYAVEAYAKAIAAACERAFPPPAHLARQRVQANGRKRKSTRWETSQEWRARLGNDKWGALERWRDDHHFHPHQLRHSAATRWCEEHGADVTLMLLGDRSNKMIDVYVKKNYARAEQVAMKVG